MIDPTGNTSAPNSSQQASSGSDPILGKDDFLSLLISEMRDQDPTSPTDPSQYTDQLAQFAEVEQMTNLSETDSAAASNDYDQQAINLIGRSIGYVDDSGAARNGTVRSVVFTSTGPELSMDNGDTGILPVTVTSVTDPSPADPSS